MSNRLKGASLVPLRLKQARQARGITASELAELVGVSRQMINRYESGASLPSPEVCFRLAQELNVPIGFFSKPVDETDSAGAVFYRKAAATTDRVQRMVEERVRWIWNITSYIEKFVDLPKKDLPDFGNIERPDEGWNYDVIEELAAKTRRAWGLGDGPIGNLVMLLEQHGVIIGRLPEMSQHVDACSWVTKSHPFMLLESSKTAVRERFDLAHELGHLVLHTGIDPEIVLDKQTHKRIEDEAHRFASAFLLPKDTFSMEVVLPSLAQLQILKSRWKVSISAMVYRIRDLELIDQMSFQRLYKQISGRGWNRQEPLDDSLEKEQPSLLRESFELLIEHQIKTPEGILNDLELPQADVESLCVLPKGSLNPIRTRASVKLIK
ncbi:transcriptional regulator [Alicyclobacillus acidoterrestris]|nr:transcriptional regulator [Alicyclobacillus acidoterrestris]